MPENTGELRYLQEEAIRRAQEMRRRAVPESGSLPASGSQPASGPQEPCSQPPTPHVREEVPKNLPEANLLELLLGDGERTLILVLLLVLLEEQADTGLIFALMYLII